MLFLFCSISCLLCLEELNLCAMPINSGFILSFIIGEQKPSDIIILLTVAKILFTVDYIKSAFNFFIFGTLTINKECPLQIGSRYQAILLSPWFIIMNLIIYVVLVLLISASVAQLQLDAGTVRLNQLRERTRNSSNSILNFTAQDFDKYALKYPRPYDLVIYFYAKQIPLSQELYQEFNYTVQLYKLQGAIDSQINPTFFVRIDFGATTHKIFKMFGFEAAPNLVVSKPNMAVVSDIQRESYLKEYKWWISQTDGVVTTQKLLDFINKRTKKNIIYKPTDETIEYVLKIFIAVCVGGVIVYKMLKFIWNHWFFWYLASIIIYMVCMSGIVYCIINGSIDQDIKRGGRIQFFSGGGSREQSFFQGCLVSAVISLTGIVLVIIAVSGEKIRQRYSAIIGVLGLLLVYYLINYVEKIYSLKGWYGPSYQPPQGYLRGPLSVDQGNNI